MPEPQQDAHVHQWTRRQNVTSKGYVLPPYEACACGAAHVIPFQEDSGDGLPDCEGWTCQSCGADNFIPHGFIRVIPSEGGRA